MNMMDDSTDGDAFDTVDFSNSFGTSTSSAPPLSPLLSTTSSLRSSPALPSTPLAAEHSSLQDESSEPRSDIEVDDLLGDDDSEDDMMEFETAGITTSSLQYPKGHDAAGNPWVTIVDITGVHHLPVHFCKCDKFVARHIQLLRLGLYPASYDRPQTVFTFRVLDDFDLENLETKAAAQRYYTKLKRLTCNAFPQTVPDRYREMLRIMHEWRNLKLRKRAGLFGKDLGKDIAPGGLALFCPACPQPGVNLPDDWNTDRDEFVYSSSSLTVVADN